MEKRKKNIGFFTVLTYEVKGPKNYNNEPPAGCPPRRRSRPKGEKFLGTEIALAMPELKV